MANDISAAATGMGPIVETVSGKLRGSLDNGIHTLQGCALRRVDCRPQPVSVAAATARLERRPRGPSLSRPQTYPVIF
jgi:hypothetical protein